MEKIIVEDKTMVKQEIGQAAEERFEAKWAANLARTKGVLSATGVPKETPITKIWTPEKRMLGIWVEIPEEAKDAIEKLAKNLEAKHPGVFVANPREAFHISVKNLAICDKEEAVLKMQEIAKELGVSKIDGNNTQNPIRPIREWGLKLEVKGINAFPVAVVAQVFDTNGQLQKLHEELVKRLGVMGFEGDNFMAHVSLGRLTPGSDTAQIIKEIEQGLGDLDICSFAPSEAILIRSEFYTPGSKYHIDGGF